jgi:hypothetical protein
MRHLQVSMCGLEVKGVLASKEESFFVKLAILQVSDFKFCARSHMLIEPRETSSKFISANSSSGGPI